MLTMYINVINRALVGSDILTHRVLQVPNFKNDMERECEDLE